MPDLLLYGDTEHSATLRHELPIVVGDAFLLAEAGGQTFILTNSLWDYTDAVMGYLLDHVVHLDQQPLRTVRLGHRLARAMDQQCRARIETVVLPTKRLIE